MSTKEGEREKDAESSGKKGMNRNDNHQLASSDVCISRFEETIYENANKK